MVLTQVTNDVIDGHRPGPPELILEWVMLFPNGKPASAVKRTNDHAEAQAWAKEWASDTTLHRRVVMVGAWHPADLVVPIELEDLEDDVEDLEDVEDLGVEPEVTAWEVTG